MPLATASTILQDYTLELMLLAQDQFGAPNRRVPTDTLTIQSTANPGASTITLRTSNSRGTYLRAGIGLTFLVSGSRRQAVVLDDVEVLSTDTTVNVSPLSRAIPASSTALIVAPISLTAYQATTNATAIYVTSNVNSQILIPHGTTLTFQSAGTVVTTNGSAIIQTGSVSTSGAAAAATSVTLTNNNSFPVTIPGGAILNFGGSKIATKDSNPATINAGQTLSVSGLTVGATALVSNDSALVPSVITASSNTSITSGNAARFLTGLIPLCGINQIDLANQETQVDTTNLQSGSGTEYALVRVARSYTINGIALAGDECLETIVKPVGAFNSEFLGREVYAVATFPDGERLAGTAKITAFNMPANQNEVKKYSFNLTFQGRAFTWTAPYTF